MRLGTTNRRLDTKAITEGVEVECPFREGFFVTILPAARYNPRFRKAIQTRPLLEDDEMSAIQDRYEDPAFVVDALVGGMRGVYDDEGNAVDYTRDMGVAVLADPGNADVLSWVSGEAMTYGRFYTQGVEEDVKN